MTQKVGALYKKDGSCQMKISFYMLRRLIMTAPMMAEMITRIAVIPGHVRTFDALEKSADSVIVSQRALTPKSSSTTAPLARNIVVCASLVF